MGWTRTAPARRPGLQRAHEVRGLGGDVHAGGERDALERALLPNRSRIWRSTGIERSAHSIRALPCAASERSATSCLGSSVMTPTVERPSARTAFLTRDCQKASLEGCSASPMRRRGCGRPRACCATASRSGCCRPRHARRAPSYDDEALRAAAYAITLEQTYDVSPSALAFALRVLNDPVVNCGRAPAVPADRSGDRAAGGTGLRPAEGPAAAARPEFDLAPA